MKCTIHNKLYYNKWCLQDTIITVNEMIPFISNILNLSYRLYYGICTQSKEHQGSFLWYIKHYWRSLDTDGGLDDVKLARGDLSALKSSGDKILLSLSSFALLFKTSFLSSMFCSIDPRTNSLQTAWQTVTLNYLTSVSQNKTIAIEIVYKII